MSEDDYARGYEAGVAAGMAAEREAKMWNEDPHPPSLPLAPSKPWTIPMIALGILLGVVLGGTMLALLLNPS
jgi:hypothetical protein